MEHGADLRYSLLIIILKLSAAMFKRSDIVQAEAEIAALSTSQAVIRFTPDGTILEANANFLGAMGYTLEEIKGKHHRMFVEESYAASLAYREFWRALAAGDYQSAQFRRLGKGGKEIWIEASYNPIRDKHGKVLYVVKYATDISQQKLKDADYKGQIDAIGKSQAVIHFNLDGTILDANANFLKTVGYALDEIKGKHHRMFADASYAQSAEYREFWQRLNQGEYVAGQFHRVGKGGREVWLEATYNPIMDMNGHLFKVVKYATDITAQMKARLQSQQLTETIHSNSSSVAAAAEEMTASISEISRNMANSSTSVNDIAEKIHEADEGMRSLVATSRSMQQVVDLIRDIAGKVNLLALNATIEAARAGDSGKGFAVVAAEVKILASQTAQATDEIANKIVVLQTMAGEAADSTSAIKDAATSVNSAVNAVAAAIEEQTAVTREITQSMHQTSSSVDRLNDCIKNISAA